MNNLDIAAEYSVRLVDELLAGQTLDEAFFLPTEIDRSRIALLSIRSIEERFRSVLKVGTLVSFAGYSTKISRAFIDWIRSFVQSTSATSSASFTS